MMTTTSPPLSWRFRVAHTSSMTLVVACISVVNMVFFTLSLDEFIALQFHELPILNHSGLSLELLLLGTLISEQVMNAVELIVRHRSLRETPSIPSLLRATFIDHAGKSFAAFAALSAVTFITLFATRALVGDALLLAGGITAGAAGLVWGGAHLIAKAAGPRADDEQIADNKAVVDHTLPLIFLPLGRALRLLIVLLTVLPIITAKLIIYFLYFALASPLLATLGHVFGWNVGRPLDIFDDAWEWLERFVNHLYNSLYYCKINERSNAFTTCFNITLPLWCLNH